MAEEEALITSRATSTASSSGDTGDPDVELTTPTRSRNSDRSSRPRSSRRRGGKRPVKSIPALTGLIFHPIFLGLFGLLFVALGISFWLVLMHPDDISFQEQADSAQNVGAPAVNHVVSQSTLSDGPHLTPRLPHLPPFATIDNADQLERDTLFNQKPTIAGIGVVLNKFITALHQSNLKNSQAKEDIDVLIKSYFDLAKQYLSPLEDAYRGRSIFPIREDDSIYVSLAAFREHLLCQTLKSAFDQAKDPNKLYIGAIVQNCFGNDGRQCKTGLQVVGKNAQGKDQVQQFDAPPDANGIEDFCTDPAYKRFCDNGQVRALYIHDTDALGPAVARYYASKLWGGETYFMQMDSHLEFAPHWDAKYVQEVKAAKNFPKAVLSAYPPGFQDFGQYQGGTPGARLCTCEFSSNGVEAHIIRINTGKRCKGDEPRPTQIAFIAAGFFFARSEFLTDVPFDPYVPWCFMGEEIALSMRAWTQGWNIYAPRQNLIAHQYRPGRLGLPKFWESVGRDSHRPNLNTRLQQKVIRRIKHMVGYPTDTTGLIQEAGDTIVLTDYEHFSLGAVRSREAYLELTNIDVVNQQCKPMHWCNYGELE